MYSKIILYVILACPFVQVNAHEWTPTYPTMRYSFIDGIVTTQMKLLNKRKDINWYEVSVLDDEFNPVPFQVSGGKIQKVSHLQRKFIDVYVRESDLSIATYICSRSKSITDTERGTFIASRICSKLRK